MDINLDNLDKEELQNLLLKINLENEILEK
jgi:hypothetical protein